MNIFIVCSKHFYYLIPPIKDELERSGHSIALPNSYDDPFKEEERKLAGSKEHIEWKSAMIRLQEEKVKANDAVLVLNFEKNGQKNYIGGATFLEIFRAFDARKKIFMYNPVPDSIFRDELVAFDPIVIDGDLSKVR
jgi:hypothetical protein